MATNKAALWGSVAGISGFIVYINGMQFLIGDPVGSAVPLLIAVCLIGTINWWRHWRVDEDREHPPWLGLFGLAATFAGMAMGADLIFSRRVTDEQIMLTAGNFVVGIAAFWLLAKRDRQKYQS